MTRVTVLLTTYNHEKYIAQALDSVLMQETNFDYEVVVLEDCSTDATRDILKVYQQQHPIKIRLRLAERNQHSNKPFAEEFNATASPYLAMLDGDDYWTSSTKLQRQVDFLDSHSDCAICFHNALRIYEGEERAPLLYNSAQQKPISNIDDLWHYCFIAGCSPLLRKAAVGTLPQWYNELPVGDWPLFLLAAQHGKIGYIDDVLGVYRIHQGGEWSKRDNVQRIELLLALYEKLNASFDFRYNTIVQPLIFQWRERLEVAHRTTQFLTDQLPSASTVIVVARPDEELPQLSSRTVRAFPVRAPRDSRQVFASGATGSAEAAWIEKGIYRFDLFRAGEERRLLASVAVSQANGNGPSHPPQTQVGAKEPHITATPNPVPRDSGPGKTLITWSTGDGSPGVVEVTLQDRQLHYPRNSAAAIEEMEQLRREGGQFLFVPCTALPVLERYPELRTHIEENYQLVRFEPETGSLYALPSVGAEAI
jgi:glycosyltransferase involved in cell wall biosynthesis